MKFWFYKWIYVLSPSEGRLQDWAWAKLCGEVITELFRRQG